MSRVGRSYALWIAVAVILGTLLIALSAWRVKPRFSEKPNVGIIEVFGVVDTFTADEIRDLIHFVKEDPSIKAVVLKINSPGGTATAVEEVYFDILRLRQDMPVVASVGLGASGGYYIAMPANFIYAKPTSIIGNIGATVRLPDAEEISDDIATTGPFKSTGLSRRRALAQLEMVKEGFLQVVLFHRGERLKLSPEELAQAAIYNGVEGLRFGLIDALGSTEDAIEKAAELAGIKDFGTIDVNREFFLKRLKELVDILGLRGPDLNPELLKALQQLQRPHFSPEGLPVFNYLYGREPGRPR